MRSALPAVGSAASFPTSHHYGWFALGFLAFAVYGSLVPLDFRPLAIGDASARYWAAWQVPIRVESRSDWLSNILLFIPLGFLLTGWLAVDRPRRAVGLAVLAIPIASAVLSAAIEFAQVYFPSRTVSSRDVVAETIGGLIGGVVWLASGPWLTRLARDRPSTEGGPAAWLLPGYLLVLVLSHVMPLDLILSPSDLYHKYTAGMIRLVPFTATNSEFTELARRTVDEAASFLVLGLLLNRTDLRWFRRPWSLLMLGLAVAGSIEFLQVFIASRRCDSTDAIIGGLALFVGWVAGRAILPQGSIEARLACLAGWLGLVVISAWFPFDFSMDRVTWLDKASGVALLPFADYYKGSVMNAADQVFRKGVLFIPLGMVLGWKWSWTLLASAALATLIEVGQLGLPGRVPSLTDVLVSTGGAWLGRLSLNLEASTTEVRATHHPLATRA